MPIDALSVLCAQLTCDLLAIAKFLFISRHVTAIEFQMCCCALNFSKIEWFFVNIWWFNDFQDGSHLQSWILRVWQWILLKSPCKTSYFNHQQKIIALNCLVLRKLHFVSAFWWLTKDKQMDSTDAREGRGGGGDRILEPCLATTVLAWSHRTINTCQSHLR